MRIVIDFIDNIFASIRLAFLFVFAAMVLFGLFATFGTGYFLAEGAQAAAQHSERKQYLEMQAEREERLAEGGWGIASETNTGVISEHGNRSRGWGDDD